MIVIKCSKQTQKLKKEKRKKEKKNLEVIVIIG